MIPKTNLFNGDRVRLSERYIASMEIANCYDNARRDLALYHKTRTRTGVIINDTLNPKFDYIRVLWDGNKTSNYHMDFFNPDDLTLVEDELVVAA